MLCTCNHSLCDHYIDYAGPGISGGIATTCNVCNCRVFIEDKLIYYITSPANSYIFVNYYTSPANSYIFVNYYY